MRKQPSGVPLSFPLTFLPFPRPLPGNGGTLTVAGLEVDERPLVLDGDLRLDGDLIGEDALDVARSVI